MNLIDTKKNTALLKELSVDMHQGINTVTEKVEYLTNGVPILQSKHITKGFLDLENTRYLSETAYSKYQSKYQAKVDDVLVCNIGTIGKSLRINVDAKFLIAWNLFLIKLDKDKLYSQYFAHYLNYLSDKKYFDRFLTGGTVKFINKKTMGNIPIPLPPIPQQKKIAAILDAADAYRQKTKALIAKYEELSQSLFLDMFGDPVGNDKNLSKIKLGELGKWMSGGTPSRKNIEYFNGIIPWLSSGELEKMFISDSKEHISELALNESNAKIIEEGSLLLGMYDTAALKSTISTAKLTCNQAIAYCKLDNKLVNTIYVYKIIQLGKEHYRRLQRGVRQKNLNLSMVKNIEILHPPLSLQNQFAERTQAIEAQKAQARQSLQKAEDLFNSLLQKAFKGELGSAE